MGRAKQPSLTSVRALPCNSRFAEATSLFNASPAVLLTHGTSPDAIEAYLDRGVEVRSCETLHAKVLATATTAVIGSANASERSKTLQEAIVVSDNAGLRSQVADFVRNLPGTIALDDLWLDGARQLWARGRSLPSGHPSGTSPAPGPAFLPVNHRLYLADIDWYQPGPGETEIYERHARRLRRAAGPAATYCVGSYRMEAGGPALRRDDVLIEVDRNPTGPLV